MHPFASLPSMACLVLISTCAGADLQFSVAADAKPGGDGSAAAPFQNLVQARDALRLARTGVSVSATVTLGPGIYRLDSTLAFRPEDGGADDAYVTYRAATPGTAHIHGGITLDPASFKPVTDAAVLDRLDAAVRSKVLVCDLGACADFEAFKASYSGVPAGPWLYLDGRPMTVARWPNSDAPEGGWATFSKTLDNGLPHPEAADGALRKLHPGTFVFDDPRPGRWHLEEGAWLFGYWTHDWADEVIRIAAYDREHHAITLAAPHHYGIKGGTWGSAKRRFFALNILEELDAPGEWYLDRARKRLYLYPPAPLGQSSIVLATLSQPLVAVTGARNMRFIGLDFEFGHGDALVLRNANRIAVAGCTVANCAGDGVVISGTGNTVRSCDLFQLGKGGLRLDGGDRLSLACAGNVAENNHIHHYGLFKRTYAAGIEVSGCGQIVRCNRIHHAPHNAILYGGNEHLFELNDIHQVVLETGDAGAIYTGRDWCSQGNILRHNFIHDLGGGDAHVTNTMGVYLDDCDCGDTVVGNIFLRAGRAIMVGGGRDNPITNNLIIDCPIGLHIDARGMTWKNWNDANDPSWCLEEKAKRLHYTQPPWSVKYPRLAAIMQESPREPLNNPIRRNVFIDCGKKVCDFDGNVMKLITKLELADNLSVNTHGAKSLAVVSGLPGFTQLSGTDEAAIDLGFANPQHGDFTIAKEARLFKELPAFEPIPCAKIGLFTDEHRRELPARPAP